MKIVEVPAEVMQNIINYLTTKPYNEVAGLLVQIAPTGRVETVEKIEVGAPVAVPTPPVEPPPAAEVA